MTNAETWNANYERVQKARKELGQINKAAIFAALAAAGIELVLVTFDGEGDSGQIDEITAYAGEAQTELPSTSLTLHQARWNKDDPKTV